MSEKKIVPCDRLRRTNACARLTGLIAVWVLGSACLIAQDVKLPVPSPEELAKANEVITEVYAERVASAKTPSQKKTLCEKLIENATTSQDPANRYGLLNAAIRLAIDAGDLETGMKAETQVSDRYQVDTFYRQQQLIVKTAQNAATSVQHRAIVEQGFVFVRQAVRADRFDDAMSVLQVVADSAKRTQVPQLDEEIRAAREEIADIANAYQQIRQHVAALEDWSHAVDPESNEAVGKYRCFLQGDWAAGLSMLAISDDPNLAAMATSELRKPDSQEAEIELGDQWWEFAGSHDGLAGKQIRRRAAYWYQHVLPQLSGLNKSKVESRLAGIDSEKPWVADSILTPAMVPEIARPKLKGPSQPWVAYDFRQDPERLLEVVEYTNLVFDYGWVTYGDALLRLARSRRMPVVLSVNAKDWQRHEQAMCELAAEYSDIVIAVNCARPFFDGLTEDDLKKIGQRLKSQVPEIEFWSTFCEFPGPLGKRQTHLVPPEVDLLIVRLYAIDSIKLFNAQVEATSKWRVKAGKRPVAIEWTNDMRQDQSGLVPKVPASAFAQIPLAIRSYDLAGVAFDSYTDAPVGEGVFGIARRPELVSTIKRLSAEVAKLRDTGPRNTSGKRTLWKHPTGYFAETEAGIWEELSPNGKRFRYTESTRNDDYVELKAVTGDTHLRYRLHEWRAELGHESKPDFRTRFMGQWISQE